MTRVWALSGATNVQTPGMNPIGLQDWFGLDGKRALVTGASRGLGREMALALAAAGADIIITGRTQETLDATAADIRALGRQAWTVESDMACAGGLREAARAILADMGRSISSSTTSATAISTCRSRNETLETGEQLIDLNLTSCFIATKIFGDAMIERGAGRADHQHRLDQRSDRQPRHRRARYETGKAAVLHFTRCAAADWAPHGITVNAICPGLFMTDANRVWNEKRRTSSRRSSQRADGPGRQRPKSDRWRFISQARGELCHRGRLRHRRRLYALVAAQTQSERISVDP